MAEIELMSDHIIDGEQAYPIYKFSATWHQDNTKAQEFKGNWIVGLPNNRFGNGTSFRKMFKEIPHTHELEILLLDWWESYKAKKLIGTNPSTPLLRVDLFEWETWYLTWFQHETFDIGQSDREALDSFERFVRRKEDFNLEMYRKTGEKETYCLMGAEDRWRWHGAEPNGNGNDRSDPPCRCKHCKEQGVIRIGH